LEELLPVVLDDWESVMTTREYVPWIPVEQLLVESLGLTKAGGIVQSYSQQQMFLLALPDTFIIDSSMRRDRQWQRAWRVSRPRPPDRSTFTAYSRSDLDRVRQRGETQCVMVSIIGQVKEDEHNGLLIVISLTQTQLEEIGSDKLPSFPWDPGVHLATKMFHYMMTQVAPESHIHHQGLVWSGPAGICLMEQGSFSLLIIMIGHGDGWAGTTSIETFLQMQLRDSRSNFHGSFSLRIQEWRIQHIYREQSNRVNIVQCQHGDLLERLAWDPGIAGFGFNWLTGASRPLQRKVVLTFH
jgi:hypothetical protein